MKTITEIETPKIVNRVASNNNFEPASLGMKNPLPVPEKKKQKKKESKLDLAKEKYRKHQPKLTPRKLVGKEEAGVPLSLGPGDEDYG